MVQLALDVHAMRANGEPVTEAAVLTRRRELAAVCDMTAAIGVLAVTAGIALQNRLAQAMRQVRLQLRPP